MTRRAGLCAAAALFVILATANAGGYRYGASDQAFYGPAIARQLTPALFPRDTSVLAPQMRVWLGDDVFAALVRLCGNSQPVAFAVVYTATLLILAGAAMAFARGLGGSGPMVTVLLLLVTLRHQIPKTGANSLEGYMHPRMLAFALGVAALACAVRRRSIAAGVWTIAAAVIHPTTALWFAVVVVTSALLNRADRRLAIAAAAAAGAVVVALATVGPLRDQLVVMDPAWLEVLADKDYLFASDWPLRVWALNLAYPIVLILLFRARSAAGDAVPGERALVSGLLALVVIFAVSVPFTAARLAVVVQLQINRVFWLLDFAVAVYLAWWLTSGSLVAARPRLRSAIIVGLAVLAIGRGTYVLAVDPGRPLVQATLDHSPWTDVMRWLDAQPPSWHVLADPAHAWKYGPSVRLAARKDTLLEAGKDPAMAIYDRRVAMRVADRAEALTGFEQMTSAQIRALDARYDLDVVVFESSRPLDLPVLYRNQQFVVYDLR